MASVKIIHCADVHLGANVSFLGSRAKQRQTETLRTFQKTVEFAVKEDVKAFLIAGDLFDSFEIDFSFIREVLSSISSANGVKFFYSAGNHDPLDLNSPLRKAALPSNLYIFDTKDSVFTFDDLKLRVYGRSFKEVYDKGEECFSLIPPDDDFINIMCIHGELTSDKNSDYNPITQQFITESRMDYIALGHIHKCTDIGRLGSTDFAYCGCLEGQGFDESGKKGILMGNISKANAELSFVPLCLRAHITESVDISSAENSSDAAQLILNHLADTYGEKYSENLYKIVLTGTAPEAQINVSEINTRLGEKLFFVKTKDETSPAVNLELLATEPSLKGIFVKRMLERIDTADEASKPALNDALKLGLKAFLTEVPFDED